MNGDDQNMGRREYANPVQVERFLEGMNYPVDKQKLVEHARKEGADDMVMRTLEALPEQEYNSLNDVSEAIGELE